MRCPLKHPLKRKTRQRTDRVLKSACAREWVIFNDPGMVGLTQCLFAACGNFRPFVFSALQIKLCSLQNKKPPPLSRRRPCARDWIIFNDPDTLARGLSKNPGLLRRPWGFYFSASLKASA